MRGLAAALALSIAACGGADTKAPEKPKQEAVDERTAEKDAKGLVKEIYQSIGHSNTDGLMALLTDKLIVFGPRKADAMATREDVLVTLRGTLDSLDKRDKPDVRSGALNVVASQGGLSAWAVDTIEIAGDQLAVTVVLENDDDFWRVVAAAVAKTPTMKSVRAELKKEAVVPTGMQGIPKVDDKASGAVDRFKKGLADSEVWAEDLGKRGDAVVIGAAAGEITRGKKAIAALWKKRQKVNVRYASAGEVTAQATGDGQIAWVTAPVVRFADDEDVPLPLRLFAVFEKVGGEWKMISLQESVAMAEDGAGASFKKIAAPGVKVEEPPPPPPKKEEPVKKKKKKKKKKKSE
ncbi:MAG: SnoaL-like domain-containing protein [Kofleriaceae bacterium]|nr:SnoaL-like domain-containing protein [Kofleriaceae bacterium]